MNNRISIQLTNITKRYTIHHEKPTLVEKFIKGNNESFTALNDINITIGKGEKVGIIGPNGSGKTTFLKIITGITTPTSGTVKTYGKVVSLIDLDAGFHPDLTGYQNIYLNGMLLGMSRHEIVAKLNSIIRFADIKQFIDVPLFMYSQGMILRLGFSVAIFADPDILVLDESFTVGDAYFQKKCQQAINRLFRRNKTILFASHWLEYVNVHWNRIIELKRGEIVSDTTKSTRK